MASDDKKKPALAVLFGSAKEHDEPDGDESDGDEEEYDEADEATAQEFLDAVKGDDPKEVLAAFKRLAAVCK